MSPNFATPLLLQPFVSGIVVSQHEHCFWLMLALITFTPTLILLSTTQTLCTNRHILVQFCPFCCFVINQTALHFARKSSSWGRLSLYYQFQFSWCSLVKKYDNVFQFSKVTSLLHNFFCTFYQPMIRDSVISKDVTITSALCNMIFGISYF